MQIAIDLPWARHRAAPVELPNLELPHIDVAAKVEDTKRAVSDGADTIGTVAQDLGSQAASLGREAMKIGRDAAKISRDAARKGQLLAASSGNTLRQLRADAGAVADDLRSIRIVRERQRGLDLRPGAALLAGASAGAAAMFFLDPRQGRRRRVRFMDQVRTYARLASEWLDVTGRELRNRSQGWAIEARRAAEAMRPPAAQAEPEPVMATPDIPGELTSTDWPEPATAAAHRAQS